MAEENGKNPESVTNNPSEIFKNPIKDMSIKTIKEKYLKNELTIEDILNNNECINDLKTNPNSKYQTILSTKNISKLIDYCIYPSKSKADISYKTLRYPYYSCETLCSPCILHFSKSIKNIREANTLQNKVEKSDDKKSIEENELNISNFESQAEDGEAIPYDFPQSKEYQEQNDLMAYQVYDDYNVERFQDLIELQKVETELQQNTMEAAKKSEYNEEEREIIKEILDKIFGFLDLKFYLDETYVGYFQKIVNFLLLNEPRILLYYLYSENNLVIKKFYRHMGNASIENIFENILNYISDEENSDNNYNSNISESKFNMIIIELLDEIGCKINKEYDNNNENDIINYYEDKNKIEFICEIIINTLINNTEKNFIELIFLSNEIFMKRFELLIKKAVNLEFVDNYLNNKKTLIINLIEILLEINTVIMNSNNIENDYKEDMSFFTNPYKKIKKFENQYFCKKVIKYENIYKAFNDNRNNYMSSIKNIFESIKDDILQYPYLESNKENKGLSLMILHEWKYILSCIKLFIFQFYSIENFEIIDYTKDFYDKRLFDLSMKLYKEYPKNNLYQNIFIDMIKIINYEKTPKYLIGHFINNKNNFIENIENIIDSKDKFNLLLGPNIQILLLFFNSQNPVCIQFFNDYNNNKNKIIYKKKFENLIKPRFTREFRDIFEFTENEIFSDLNDSLDTFDGNDIDSISKIKFESLKSITKNFLDKLNFDNNNYINMSNEENQNKSLENKNNSSQNSQTQISTESTNNPSNDQIVSNKTWKIDTTSTPSIKQTMDLSISEKSE